MKCKVSDSSSGVGRPRPGHVSSAGHVSRLHKDDVALNTRSSNKGDRSEGSMLRRSSRRATIERRVWASPKKMAKAPSPNVKEKLMQPKSSRKDKEKKVQNTVQSRSTSKSKVLPDAKRGLVMTEETGNARRKIKRREGMENVGDDREDTSESAGELLEMAETTNVSDAEDATEEVASISLEERTEDVTEETSDVCDGDGNGDNGDGVDERTGSIRTGLPLLAEAVVSLKDIPSRTSNSDSSRCERGVEEMLDTGDFCLTKAIVEEVIPDFGNDASYVSSCALPEVNSRNTQQSAGQVFRNLEDVLGHSYSKPGQDCDKEDEAKAEPKSPVRAHPSTIDTSSGSEEAETENAALEVEPGDVGSDEAFREQHHEWERKKEEVIIGEGDQHTMDFSEAQLDIRLECSSKNSEVTKDGSEVYSIEESTEHLGEEDNANTLEDNDQTENESVTTSDFAAQNSDGPMTDQAISENSKGGAEEVLEEEEGHVSLSVALAQLLDSGCGEAEGTETLTIHSVSPGVQAGREEKKEVMELDVSSRAMVTEKAENEVDDDEDEEGELVIKEEEDEGVDEETNTESEEDSELKGQEGESKEDNHQNSLSIMNSTKLPELCKVIRCESEVDRHTTSPSPPPTPAKLKKQIPPLIKISSRPPAIKTPLKCPECPMQFCTVRSLLWHFGTHGARSRENCLPPILLQDLIVPWDKPTVSLFISQATDGERSTEKIIASNEMSLAVSLSPESDGKGETTNKQDLTMTTQILRADDGMGTNGDVILKVPIPRLKPKSQLSSIFKKDKFINILPKIMNSESQSSGTPATPHLTKMRSSSSPTPQLTIQAQSSKSADVVTVKPQHTVPKITIRGDNSASQVHVKALAPVSAHSAVQIKPLMTSSQSAVQIQPLLSTSQPAIQIQPLVSSSQSALQIQPLVSTSQSPLQIQPLVSSSQSGLQIQPLVSSSQSALQIQPLVSGTPAAVHPVASTTTKPSSATSHIALIPVDNLTAVGQNFSSRSKTVPPPIRMVAPPPVPVKPASTSMDGILEKDGLVMINSNLALRIVSSLPSSLDSSTSTTTSTTTIRPVTTQLTTANNLTILPQVEGSKLANSKKEGLKNPDILTIVPQIDVNKKGSLFKNVPPNPNTHTSTKSSAASQVVKLYLLQPKDVKGGSSGDSTAKLGITADQSIGMNGLEVPLTLSNGNENTAISENGNLREHGTDEDEEIDDLDDDDEEGMVIDDEREGEEDVMDPLSLCAVTMEDENLEASNSSIQAEQFSTDSVASSEDKVTIRKIVGKPKGKTNQGLDIVKYEARKYVCCYCNRRFGWSTDLKRHVILHTGEKPFQCKVCPTAFTRKFLLQNHMKRMHPDKCKMSDLWP
ncbi:uncharacterized protein LOC126996478 isoform X2 [Eriocheir sinensis]|uniref:uncharacterized protein LOC126996478 isoform X2 n=1 Tax=Eriocheir sinensis TaxID=95602 RepID=UPI0021C707A1|nr:uncharacterized protein LOC126996478 isoform X2 [Eriocheir sinensis]